MNNLAIQSQMNQLSGFGQINSRPEVPAFDKIAATNTPQATADGKSFKDLLTESISKVNGQMIQADQKVEALASGKSEDIHGTIIEMQKADVSFRLLLEVRKKMLDAYQEVMRMQA